MAALVTVADIKAELPAIKITVTSIPNEAQIAGYIDDTESEIRAYTTGRFGVWPTVADSDAAKFVRRTILEGVRYLTLRAKYGTTRSDMIPEEVTMAKEAFEARIKRLDMVFKGIAVVTPIATGGVGVPVIYPSDTDPNLTGSFAEWTARVDYEHGRSGKVVRR